MLLRLISRSPITKAATTVFEMDIDWGVEVVDQIDSHWQQQLRPRMEGLTDDEYFWQPVADCWTVSRRGQSSAPISFGSGEFTMDYAEPPYEREPVTTIAWRLAHIIVGLASTNDKVFGQAAADESTFAYAGTAQQALQQLDDEYERWIDGVCKLGAAGLAQPQGFPPSSPTLRWHARCST